MSTLTVRLDQRTDEELAALVEHYEKQDRLGQRITPSQVARSAIHHLYESELAGRKGSG